MRKKLGGMAAFAALLLCAACELFVKIPDDATGGSPDAAPATDASVTTPDAGSVANDATAPSTLDAGTESDASWQFVSSDGTSGTTITLTTSEPVKKGDLLIVGCDTVKGATLPLVLPPGVATMTPVGPFSSSTYEDEVWLGTVETPPSGGLLTVSVTPTPAVGFMDCTINVYRGGSSGWAVVQTNIETDSGAGNVTCGPVDTVPRGVAFYIAVRYTCAGNPLGMFTQRQDLEGNPNGDLETDGAVASTVLAQCANSTGDWACLTVSVAP